jgi:hypothetical protein
MPLAHGGIVIQAQATTTAQVAHVLLNVLVRMHGADAGGGPEEITNGIGCRQRGARRRRSLRLGGLAQASVPSWQLLSLLLLCSGGGGGILQRSRNMGFCLFYNYFLTLLNHALPSHATWQQLLRRGGDVF